MMPFEVVVICRELHDDKNITRHCIDLTRIRTRFYINEVSSHDATSPFLKSSSGGRTLSNNLLGERTMNLSFMKDPGAFHWWIIFWIILG